MTAGAAPAADDTTPAVPRDVTRAEAPTPRPALKPPKRGAYPFAAWSYAKAYTYNFFPDRNVPLRVVSSAGAWSPFIRSEQVISDAQARHAAGLTALTKGSIELTKCSFPRHAIVYFDASDKPVASVAVCFDCEAVLAWPDYPHADGFDYERAARSFEKALPDWRRMFEGELGLPIDYRTAPPAR